MSEFRLFNKQLLYAGYGLFGDGGIPTSPNMNLFDLGLNSKAIFGNPAPWPGGDHPPEFLDMFSTGDGKIFALTRTWGYGLATGRLYCFDLEGNEIAHYDFPSVQSTAYGFAMRKIAGQLEDDGVFRIYAVGWDMQGGGVDPDWPQEDAEWACDCVFCLKFDGTTFTKEWYYYDLDSYSPTQLIDSQGRGYSIYAMKPMAGTVKQCCLVSTIVKYEGYPQCTARITMFSSTGTPTKIWEIPLNDPEAAPDVPYGGVSLDGLKGNPDWHPIDCLECALVYRNKNHYLYFRGDSTYYPDTLFRLNLTTGATEEQLSAAAWDPACRVKLAGLYDSEIDPYNCDRLLMQDREVIKMVSLDDLTTVLFSRTVAECFPCYRPGFWGYFMKFGWTRMNRELKFSND